MKREKVSEADGLFIYSSAELVKNSPSSLFSILFSFFRRRIFQNLVQAR